MAFLVLLFSDQSVIIFLNKPFNDPDVSLFIFKVAHAMVRMGEGVHFDHRGIRLLHLFAHAHWYKVVRLTVEFFKEKLILLRLIARRTKTGARGGQILSFNKYSVT